MIPLAEAQEYVLGRLTAAPATAVDRNDSLGLVTAEPIMSGENIPPFDNTAMDGFALRAEDVAAAPVDLDVVGTIAAGAHHDRRAGTTRR